MKRWTIKQLVEQVDAVLSRVSLDQTSGRIRQVPDVRTLRYYTTAGLLDKPLAYRGRTALYGRRHLLQILAIKRLQSDGQRLGAIQEALAGLTDAQLEALAALPSAPEPLPDGDWQAMPRQTPFWQAAPAPVPTPSAPLLPAMVSALRLAPGVTLMLDVGSSLSDADRLAIAQSAAPLLTRLADLGLLSEVSHD